MAYEVTTAVFEGPFDLLLHLITRQQVDIYQVSLSSIVDAYVAEIEHLPGVDLDVATEFLLIAAVLLELKARRLLPGSDEVEDEEELALWEERDLLLARLFECKTFKDAAAALNRMMDAAGRSFPRRAGLEERFLEITPDLLAGVTPDRLRRACLAALTPRPVPPRGSRARGPDPGQRGRRRQRTARRAAPGGHHHLRSADRGAGRAAGGDRAIPGRSRVVQAGLD